MSAYVLTEAAERDLNEIWDFIADQSIEQADAVAAEICEAIELLASSPGIGPPASRCAGRTVSLLAR